MSINASTGVAQLQFAMYRMLEFVASKMCNKHGKRIMFISSLYAQITQLERLKADTVSKLNAVMGLATREEAIQLPVTFSRAIWRGKDISSVLTPTLMDQQDVDQNEIQRVAKQLIAMAPAWMRYPEQDMERDLTHFLLNGRELAAAA